MGVSRTRGMPRRTATAPARSTIPLRWIAAGAAVLVVLAAAVAYLVTSGSAAAGEPAARLTVSGAALPALPAEGGDPAVGRLLPTLSGTSPTGEPVVIGPTGAPQVVAIMAHWCPHCQAEVPRIVDWLRTNDWPNGATLTTLSTAIDPARPNYPPSTWLAREGWTAPILTDDAAGSGLAALGIGSFPGFVLVNADGTVAGRLTGEVPMEQLAGMVAALR